MKTIATCVEEILISQPFLEDALTRNILNFSALAEELREPISKMLRKAVKSGAIMMALRRYSPPKEMANKIKLNKVLQNLGDITVRSDISDYTFKNSSTLPKQISLIFAKIGDNRESFFTVSQGIFETNIVISANLKEEIDGLFEGEELINSMAKLASITIKLPKTNLEQSGIYYFILKQLAWANIPVQEVISTTHEITLVVKETDINKTFSILIDLKKN